MDLTSSELAPFNEYNPLPMTSQYVSPSISGVHKSSYKK